MSGANSSAGPTPVRYMPARTAPSTLRNEKIVPVTLPRQVPCTKGARAP